MAPTKLACPYKRRDLPFSPRGLRVIALIGALSPCLWGEGALAARSLFFASREACVASGKFRAQECANAFVNADLERQRSAGAAMTQLECVRRFHLCELRKDSSGASGSHSYLPSLLGIELSNAGGNWRVSPVLAAELPPGQVRTQPISHIAVAPAADPSDSFEAEAPAVERASTAGKRAPADDTAAQARTGGNAERARAERRERIRNAPFIE